MRKLVLGAAAAAALLVAPVAKAAMPVVCTNCSTIAQQLMNYARQLEQLQQEIQTAQNTLNFYTNAVQNTASLPSTVYSNITGDIARIEGIANMASMLGGNTGTMLGYLGNTGGYPLSSVASVDQQLIAEHNALANAMTQLGNTLNLNPTQLRSNAATLAALQDQAMSADGRQKVLQTLAGINATVGQQISRQQATLAAAFQAMATAEVARADRQALLDAADQADVARALQASCADVAAEGGTSTACTGAGQ